MTKNDIANLLDLHAKATPGPWYVSELDDEKCMCAIAITRTPDTGRNESMRSGEWPTENVVAACYIQAPPYAMIGDGKEDENARLIAAVRNVLPELLQLAEKALNTKGLTVD